MSLNDARISIGSHFLDRSDAQPEGRSPLPPAPDRAGRRVGLPPAPRMGAGAPQPAARPAPDRAPVAGQGAASAGKKPAGKSAAKPAQKPAGESRRAPSKPAAAAAAAAQAGLLNTAAPVIPAHSVTGRALVAIIAIMSFLAAVTLGAVTIVQTAAGEWQSQVSRELTIQVRPVAGRDMEADVARASRIARSTEGVAHVRPYSREESAALLEPWLGSGLSFSELPVPRVIVVTAAPGAAPDLDQLRGRLAADVNSASLDDHRAFLDRMRGVARMAVTLGFGILAAMIVATVLLVVFATRGAMAANRPIIEVLHFVGAKNRYIARQFQRHFLNVGLRGAAFGGGAAMLMFLALWAVQRRADAIEPNAAALLGALVLGAEGYAGMLAVLALIALVTVVTSRWTVHRTLNGLE